MKKKLAFLYFKRKKVLGRSKRKAKRWDLHVRRKFAIKSKRRTHRYIKKQARKKFFRLKRIFLRLLLRQTKNNFHSTFMGGKRKVLWSFSAGAIGLLGPQRSTPFGAEQLGRHTLSKLRRTKVRRVAIVLRSAITRHMRGCLKYLQSSKIFSALIDLIPRPHNGLRGKKMRRL